VRVGYSRSHALNLIPFGAINPAAALTSLGSTTGQAAPIVAISGYTRNQGGVGAASNYEHAFNNYQFADDAFWTHGAHTLKFGTDIERMQYNYIARVTPGGRWNFSTWRLFSQQGQTFRGGHTHPQSHRGELRQTLIAGYVQDDWRLRSHLTLNLGLRYEMVTVIKDAQGKITSLLNIGDPAPQCGVQFDSSFAPGGQQLLGSQALSVVALALTITTLRFVILSSDWICVGSVPRWKDFSPRGLWYLRCAAAARLFPRAASPGRTVHDI